MSELTPRQKEILTLIIESHIATSLPVGSRVLTAQYELPLSPASVRHEMGILEESGYLTHPHTSAGRVPTDKGYQFYVRESVQEEPVSVEVLNHIVGEMKSKIDNLESLMARVSLILSAIAKEAVLVMPPVLCELYLKELSLVSLDSTHVLVIWCSSSGLVQDCLIELEEAISSDEVDRIRNFINQELTGVSLAHLEEELARRIESCRDSLRRIYERTLQIVKGSLMHWNLPRLVVEGSRYILNQPEFQDVTKIRLLMEMLEEKSSLIGLLTNRPSEDGVHVAIGEKELSKNIWDCSLVTAGYALRGKPMGVLGVLGPRRMPYGKIMGLVHRIAGEMGQALERWSA